MARRRLPPNWKENLFKSLRQMPVQAVACEYADVNRNTVNRLRRESPRFAEQYEEAILIGLSKLEVRAQEVALDSDNPDSGMIKWLLARRIPDVYGDPSHKVEHTGEVTLNLDFGGLDLEIVDDDHNGQEA